MTRQSIGRLVALASTVLLSWGALTVGIADEGSGGPAVGEVATRDYVARRPADVVDVAATERAQAMAAAAVAPTLVKDDSLEDAAYERLRSIISAVRAETAPIPSELEEIPPTTTTTVPPTTTTSEGEVPAEDEEEEPIPIGVIEGLVFVDVNGDGVFDRDQVPEQGWTTDRAWSGLDVVAVGADGSQYREETAGDGTYAIEVPQGEYTVLIDTDDSRYPTDFGSSTDTISQAVTCGSELCEAAPVGLTAEFLPVEEVIELVEANSPLLGDSAWATLIDYGRRDVYRAIFGSEPLLDTITAAAQDRLAIRFQFGISSEELADVQRDAQSDVTSVLVDGIVDPAARDVVNQLVAVVVAVNEVIDTVATEADRAAAVSLVQDVTRSYGQGITIVRAGEEFTQLTLDAVNETGANVDRTVRLTAIGGVLAMLVAVLAFYLGRFRKVYWDRPRMVALFGMLIVLGAGAVRLTTELQGSSSVFILPAVAFGYLAAVLFDNRMGTLMALAMGVLALVGTNDPGAGIYAALATLAPIGFVSSVSTRRAFRNSVLVSGAVGGGHRRFGFVVVLRRGRPEPIQPDLAGCRLGRWRRVVRLVGGVGGDAVLRIDVRHHHHPALLELTDRNHEALQLLQEKAFGSFNHSLMVGTLADAAARAIGANNLLAGRRRTTTTSARPRTRLFFIENQFGISNPHDELPARGVGPGDPPARARRDRTGQEVQHPVRGGRGHRQPPRRRHHALLLREGPPDPRSRQRQPRRLPPCRPQAAEPGDGDPHDGRRRRGACRAVFAEEEPKPESIAKVVNRVVDEKVGDGQLSECDLTLGELSTVRKAFIDALTGHYHQRIPYPNFPGS
jgi:cyclic-di-AMP phosphodiesterase PgpH